MVRKIKVKLYQFYLCRIFKENITGGVDRGVKVIDKMILHNTGGSGSLAAGSGCAVHYYLARNEQKYGNKFVIRIPEYQTSETASSTLAEQRAIDIEMVNWEWANPAKSFSDQRNRIVKDGKFNDLDNVDHYVEISGDKYDLVNYYFQEKDGFFEVFNNNGINADSERLKAEVRADKTMFYKFYTELDKKNKNGKFLYKYFGLKPRYLNLIASNSDPNYELGEIYKVLNKIPFENNFYTYSNKETILDFRRIMNPKDTYPFDTYKLPDVPKDQALNDKEIPDYYEKYTPEQYSNLDKFIKLMGEKYGILEQTFNKQNLGSIPQKYGFYYQKISSNEIPNQVIDFQGIISHRNSKIGGKMCPAPGFQIDRVPALQN